MNNYRCSGEQMGVRQLLILVATVVFLSGCSLVKSPAPQESQAVKMSSVRPVLPGTRELEISIPLKQYQQYLRGAKGSNEARLVQVYDRYSETSPVREYRLLDVRPNSVYELMKLQNLDIVVAANGYILPEAGLFWGYLNALAYDRGGFIEIRRKGQPLIYRYRLTE